MMNGELLDQMDRMIDDALHSKNISAARRQDLQIQRLLVLYIRQSHEDHEKMEKLWPLYSTGRWVVLTVVGVWAVAFAPIIAETWGQLLLMLGK